MVKDQGFLTQNFVGAEIDLRWNYVPGVEDDSSFVCGVHVLLRNNLLILQFCLRHSSM